MTSTTRIVLGVVLAFLAAIGGVFVGRALLPQPKQPGAALHDVLHHKLTLDDGQQARLKVLEDRFAMQRRALELEMRAANTRLAEAIKPNMAMASRSQPRWTRAMRRWASCKRRRSRISSPCGSCCDPIRPPNLMPRW
jgi:hypothetical protein